MRKGFSSVFCILQYLYVGMIADAYAGPAAALLNEPIVPLMPIKNLNPDKILLGEKLFNDVRLSRDNTVSCATCHDLKRGGVDGKKFSTGIGNAQGVVNAPTVFNAALNFRQFWDGRSANLEDQIDGPVQNPLEMGSRWEAVISKLSASKEYNELFEKLYEDKVSVIHIKDAIATFERSLVTTGSRFDQYLQGNTSAIDEKEKAGYETFKTLGCVSCHQGANVGSNMYQMFGVVTSYFDDRGNIHPSDLGRFNVTKKEEDKYFFKVPTLRNVALTAPYFHDGSALTLEDAVRTMGRYQLGRKLSSEEISSIVRFLHTLTGQYKGEFLK